MSTRHPPSVPHDAAMVRMLRNNPGFAAEYLRASLEDNADCPQAILLALRHVAEARGMQAVAEAAGIKRESLYRALSPKGNPTFKTLSAVLKAVGLQLTTEPLPGPPGASNRTSGHAR